MGFNGISTGFQWDLMEFNRFNGVEWESNEILVGFNGCLMGFNGNLVGHRLDIHYRWRLLWNDQLSLS
jgi:hypothetical protein